MLKQDVKLFMHEGCIGCTKDCQFNRPNFVEEQKRKEPFKCNSAR